MSEYKDLALRAFWTFCQTALSVAAVGPVLDLNVATWKIAVLSGAAAALSVLKSYSMRQAEKYHVEGP